MGFGSFLAKSSAYIAGTTAIITAAPVLGAVGAITAAGSAVATGIGMAAAAIEVSNTTSESENKK